MNLILLDSNETQQKLPAEDRRAEHIRKTLLKADERRFCVGIPNGPMGLAAVEVADDGSVALNIEWDRKIRQEEVYPLTLLVGLSRPQTCRKILREAASLGMKELVFFQPEKGEAAYASSSLWTSGEWERQVLEGVEQAFNTHVPKISHFRSLSDAIRQFSGPEIVGIALDNYEAGIALSEVESRGGAVVLVVGSERGFSTSERDDLRDSGFALAHLGSRVLRTETAVVAGCSVVGAVMGWHQGKML